jgi:hypothetical protein
MSGAGPGVVRPLIALFLADDQADDEADDGAEHEPEDEDGLRGLLEHGRAILVETAAGPMVELVRLKLLASRASARWWFAGLGPKFEHRASQDHPTTLRQARNPRDSAASMTA